MQCIEALSRRERRYHRNGAPLIVRWLGHTPYDRAAVPSPFFGRVVLALRLMRATSTPMQ
jgi:hypothetical protein